MAGLYLHVPFCRKACSYCNFHFSTSAKGHQEMVDAMCRELTLRSEEIAGESWTSVYFGGGTPSLLSPKQIDQLLTAAETVKPFGTGIEVTLEANPDDLSLARLEAFAKTPINRLSIGIQSFHESDLRYMNRAHTSEQARSCIEAAQAVGFHNLTVDLIYGTPGLTDERWRENIETVIALGIPHISAYALTVEPQTALAHQIATGKSRPVDEAQAARQMKLLIDTLGAAGYEHYEISNFAKPKHRAVHNSNYWLGVPYLGIGPSAHSYDGVTTRSWNVANNARYVKQLAADGLPIEREQLSAEDQYNELVLTRLRTVWGLSLNLVEQLGFGAHFLAEARPYLEQGLIEQVDGIYRLSPAGKLLADGISSDLFAA